MTAWTIVTQACLPAFCAAYLLLSAFVIAAAVLSAKPDDR